MVIEREPGQWYVGGTMAAFTGPPPFGWVDRIDAATLRPVASSPELPCGDHVWCGAILAHRDGLVMSVNGSYLHALDPDDLSVVSERRLPAERSHNGLLALADGTLCTKDLRLEGQGGTTITRLDPDTFELIGEPLELPEGSMGRIAADVDAATQAARDRRVALAQIRLSAVVVGVVPLVLAVAAVAVRGVPEPGGPIVVVPMAVGASLMLAGSVIVLVATRSTAVRP